MTQESERVLDALPKLPSNQSGAWQALKVTGLVQHELSLSARDLARFPSGTTIEDFRCEEGWVVRQQLWEGPSVWSVLERAEIAREARFVTLGAGDFSITLDMQDAVKPETRLALRLNGEPLPEEHGGPCRLIVPGKACYSSVKWVDWIDISSERPGDTAPAIALERIGRNV